MAPRYGRHFLFIEPYKSNFDFYIKTSNFVRSQGIYPKTINYGREFSNAPVARHQDRIH